MLDRTGHCQIVIGGMLRTLCTLGILSGLALISAGTLTAQAPGAGTSPPASTPDSQPPRVYGPEDHDVRPPKVLYAPNPEFTDKARRKKLGGTCVLSTLVDVQGNPQDIQVVRSIAEGLDPKLRSAAVSLDQSAMKTLRQYRFQPATLQGKPVLYRLKLEVDFRIY